MRGTVAAWLLILLACSVIGQRETNADCADLSIAETYPYEETDCYVCEDSDTGTILNWDETTLTCVYLDYSEDDNISEEDGYPEIYFDNEESTCAYVPGASGGFPGYSNITVFSQRLEWTESASMKIGIGFPCTSPYTKSFTARWTSTCPYCNY